MFYLYGPRVTQSVDLQITVSSFLSVLLGQNLLSRRIYIILIYSFYAALLLQGKRKKISAIHNTGEKIDDTEKQTPVVLYMYTIHT